MNDPLRILYLEDNPRDAELVRDRLQQAPSIACELRVASSRAEYEAALAEARFDLILSDYRLPNYDGMAALAWARAKQPDVPFILISGTLGEEQAVDCVLRGATDYVLKQRLERLVPAVLRALAEADGRQKLREARELLALYLRHSPVYAFIKSVTPTESRVLEASDSLQQLTGIPARDMVGKTMADLFPAELAAKMTADDWAVVSTGEVLTLDENLDGRNYTSIKFPIVQGDRTLLAGYTMDITERKQAEAALRVKDWAIESAINAIAISDLAGSLSYVNPAFVRLWGYESAAGILGRSVAAFWLMEDKAKEIAETVRAEGGWSGDLVAQRKDGVLFDVHVSSSLVLDATGQPIFMQASFEDITERKQAQNALARGEAKYRDLVENLNDVMYAVDLNGTITYASAPALEVMGYSPEDLSGRSFREIIHPDDLPGLDRRFGEILQGSIRPWEFRYRTKDGRVRWARTSSRPVFEEGRPVGISGLLSDITEHKRDEEQLRLGLEGTLRAVSRASETRDPYTAGHQHRVTDLALAIAHELALSEEQCATLRAAGLTHDIGKLGVPAEILSKPAALSTPERDLVRTHPDAGYGILADIPFPGPVADIVLQHHERLDGSGYPRGLKGDQMLREARILAVADVVEAMASHRPYRAARGIDAALDEIAQNAGRLYDSEACQACARLFRDKGYALPA